MTTKIRQVREILDFWIGDAKRSADAARARNALWFKKSDTTDASIRAKYSGLPDVLKGGLAIEWANDSAEGRLAAIVALDQFPRNMFRGTARAFQYDGVALMLAKSGIELGQDEKLSEIERKFFYLPLEHSEDAADQVQSVYRYTLLAQQCGDEFRQICADALSYAKKHQEVIDRFGRYPHRNECLERSSTPEELEFIQTPGSGF